MTLKLAPMAFTVTNDAGLVFTRKCSFRDQSAIVGIGPDPYSNIKRPGWFAYVVYGQVTAECLDADGTWSKYGHGFNTPEAALEALQASIDTEENPHG